ncbi:uncharacterized protein EAE98_003167 [Botrytis deweyae]|uniref:Secreted protein n=1 Tax=Botrytis deweyae TaxID=2478750 RepID=A0ABQ7IWM9_9HELO|nr:uncharacterized protein EAE98_003167 [Botrytis deweyae]KAF7935122.1 hypothetical protein EAE98_003167 [Botrytis deweyae]
MIYFECLFFVAAVAKDRHIYSSRPSSLVRYFDNTKPPTLCTHHAGPFNTTTGDPFALFSSASGLPHPFPTVLVFFFSCACSEYDQLCPVRVVNRFVLSFCVLLLVTIDSVPVRVSVFAVRNGVVAGVMNWLGGNPHLHDPPLHLLCLRLPLLILPNFVVDPYTISLDEPYVQCGGSSFRRAVRPGRRWHDRMQFLTGDQVE